jgi:hypothetical protein
MSECKPIATPIVVGSHLFRSIGSPHPGSNQFRQLDGALQYLPFV